MKAGIHRNIRRFRRFISRSEWARRILALPAAGDDLEQPGLILVQIDGLARPQLEKAIASGNMPFLKRLINRRQYELHSFYSGLPSSTPAVQGELFYGQKLAVPAFGFRDSTTGEITTMLDPDTARRVEQSLAENGPGILHGGSCFSNIYTGGATEAHFCSSQWGRDELHDAKAWRDALVKMLHVTTIPKIVALSLVEILLAFADLFRGLVQGRSFLAELKFIPTRLLICLLLREWITKGAQVDVVRGLPIIHLNFLGYDEQAHRRGPSSAFAHWTLKGIDGCIRKIWNVALLAHRREYNLWIYSDHGQEDVIPYHALTGHFLAEDLEAAAAEIGFGFIDNPAQSESIARTRVRWMSRRPHPVSPSEAHGDFAAKGPVGHVYLEEDLPDHKVEAAARYLVTRASVPMAMAKTADGVRLWTATETALLPQEGEKIFRDHPFKPEIAHDLHAIALHPDAGRLILIGWAPGVPPVSFPRENGAHAGPGPLETHGFVLAPGNAPIDTHGKQYLRPMDLREAIVNYRQDAAGQNHSLPISA